MTGTAESPGKIRIGVSSCLLGFAVRYDGGHKRDRFLTGTLARSVEWVPVCPEVELGLGVPREPIRLERRGGGIRLVAPGSGRDHTRAMRKWARLRVATLARERLCGYVLKRGSPSCGMERVPVHRATGGAPARSGRGFFAEAFLKRFPNLPVEEEGRLADRRLRGSWLRRVFAYHRLQALWARRWRLADLAAFHTASRPALLVRAPKACARLDRLVARGGKLRRAELRRRYEAEFMAALSVIAAPHRRASVRGTLTTLAERRR